MEKRAGAARGGAHARASGRAAKNGQILVHPALAAVPREGRPIGHRDNQNPAASLRSPRNLKAEGEILRFALGLLSALAFLEAEGWPWRPAPEGWALEREGLPIWTGAEVAPPDEKPGGSDDLVRAHGALLFALLGGRAPEGRGWPTVPRRHRAFPLWNAWFAGFGTETTRRGARESLLELWELSGRAGLAPNVPSAWGVGIAWMPAPLPEAGLEILECGSSLALSAALSAWASGPEAPLRPVALAGVPPYPLAALEPLASRILGGEDRGRDWMRLHLSGGEEAMVRALAGLLSEAGTGWLLWPSGSLDGASRSVLDGAARMARVLAVGLDTQGTLPGTWPPAGQARSVRLLWLPPTAEAWYLEHADALLGPHPAPLLGALSALPPDQPRCGGPLLPPLPCDGAPPARPWLGRGRPGGGCPTERDPAPLSAQGRLAQLVCEARSIRHREGGEEEGSFWEGAALFLMGQPRLALDTWRPLAPGPKGAGRLAVSRARAFERASDYPAARAALTDAGGHPLSSQDQELAGLLEGQLLWVEGKEEEAERRLAALARSTKDGDIRGQALCHLAALLLCANRPADALKRLEEARYALPEPPQPLSEFLLAHRTGMALRKTGDFSGALVHFEGARDVAAAVGFRSLEAWAECDAGNALCQLHRSPEAVACYRRAEEGAAALGLERLRNSARFDLALTQVDAGDLGAAERTFQASLDQADEGTPAGSRAVDCYWLAVVRRQRGDFPEALDMAEQGLKALEGLKDPEVRLPLLTLRGELLLATGQIRKLRFLLKDLEGELRPETEPNDRLAAAALRRLAAAKGEGAFTEAARIKAESLLERASPDHQIYWWLLSAQAAGKEGASEMERAWALARDVRNAHLACRALWGLWELGALPPLDGTDRHWLADFLVSNRVHGPERGLLPHLGWVSRAPDEVRPSPAGDLHLLARAGSDPGGTAEEALRRVGAICACVARPGRGPWWWGDGSAEQRRALVSAAGLKGEAAGPGGTLLGCCGPDGLWCGFLRPGPAGFDAEARAFAHVWVGLLRFPEERATPASRPRHPAVANLILTQSPAMEDFLDHVDRAAAFTFSVLITGEPGSGKEICAQAIHAASPRSAKAWVPANCANLSPTLGASLLFGHRKGAFTGADKDAAGLVEAARGSTLFLDEVGELPLEVQAGLLRFLQDGTYTPLGDTGVRRSDARIVAATNRDLERAVREGKFREDLFHRLNVIRIVVPPLRQHPEDVPLLFGHFLARAAKEERLDVPPVDPEVLTRLAAYSWPGNAREVQNVARGLLVAAHGARTIRLTHVPAKVRDGELGSGHTLSDRVRAAERAAIEEALREAGGSPAAAARALGITRQGLAQKMKRLKIGRG